MNAEAKPQLLWLPLSDLVPSPFNARRHFDRDELAELAASIRTEGIQQPLIVRNVDGRQQIIAGERRFRAAKIAGLDQVPCLVRDVDEAEARRIQIIENLQRQDIAPLEEAQAFQDLLKVRGEDIQLNASDAVEERHTKPTVEGLAKELGKSKEYVYNRVKLLKLSAPAQKALAAGKMDAGHAVELVALDEKKQKAALEYISRQAGYGNSVSVKELRDEIRYTINLPPQPKKSKAEAESDRKFRELQKKEAARYAQQQKAAREQQAFDKLVDARCLALLWPKLKAMDAKERERLIDEAILRATERGRLGSAQSVAAGKPLPDAWVRDDTKAFARAPRAERLALLALAITIGNCAWEAKRNEPTWKWAKIDRKQIAAAIRAEQKAAAKAPAKPVADVGKAVAKAAAKSKQRNRKAKAKR